MKFKYFLLSGFLLSFSAMADYDLDKYKNNDIMAPWNDPILQDDQLAPWNDPILKDDIMAPWNNYADGPSETNGYLRENGVNDSEYYWDDDYY